MNCKQGDLAIVVWSDGAGNEGKIVRCLELIGYKTFELTDGSCSVGAMWRIDRAFKTRKGTWQAYASDDQLRPIRDPGDDAIDEMVAIARDRAQQEAMEKA